MDRPRLAHHILRVRDLETSLTFYRQALGMTLVAQPPCPTGTRCLLGFGDGDAVALGTTLLELWHRPGHGTGEDNPSLTDGYWKIGITLKDVDVARDLLLARGVAVSQPSQFQDIGYLCHLADPDGYVIELLQHDFAHHHRRIAAEPGCPLGSAPTLGQITLRIADPEASLAFYQKVMGMRLLARQIVETHRFTLYFLACTEESPPNPHLDSVDNREWLWQRPYTTLELQHIWAAERTRASAREHDDHPGGFWGIGFVASDIGALMERLEQPRPIVTPAHHDPKFQAPAAVITDPDGFRLRLIEAP